MPLPTNLDIHTHSGTPRPDAILCVDPTDTEALPEGEGLLSVGIHPWNAEKVTPEILTRFDSWLTDSRVVAVGECGLDRACSADIGKQTECFERQAQTADKHNLPLIIHCVRATDILLRLRKKFGGQWIYHGFRGKPAAARQLLDAGIDLSFGTLYNEESFALTPAERRYRESD